MTMRIFVTIAGILILQSNLLAAPKTSAISVDKKLEVATFIARNPHSAPTPDLYLYAVRTMIEHEKALQEQSAMDVQGYYPRLFTGDMHDRIVSMIYHTKDPYIIMEGINVLELGQRVTPKYFSALEKQVEETDFEQVRDHAGQQLKNLRMRGCTAPLRSVSRPLSQEVAHSD